MKVNRRTKSGRPVSKEAAELRAMLDANRRGERRVSGTSTGNHIRTGEEATDRDVWSGFGGAEEYCC